VSARPQTRRHAWLLLAITVPVLAWAQANFNYSDSTSDLAIRARDGQGELMADGYKFDLRGAVQITSRSRRVTIQAARVEAAVGRSAGAKSPNELRSAKATGGVKVIQTAPGKTSTLQANAATYAIQGAGASVQATGLVKIINSDQAKRETLTATGSKGTAVLNPKSARGLDRATLEGPVKVTLLQSGPAGSQVVFTGGRMTMSGDSITLSKNVKATGSGASRFGNLSNVDSVTVYLNEKGEMSRFTFKSGGGT
jgi:predicted transcriptional regulator